MKKSDYSEQLSKLVDNTEYISTELNGEMKKSFIAYAMAVNVSRAIPDVRDGLKPVHRRIVYGMGAMGLTNDKPYKKCARITGDVMGKYHPHGDAAIYDALVRLAQDFSINCPLVDGHGNFGSVDGDPAAASRYTEARMSKICAELLRDINKNTVDFIPNYDGEEVEPVVLPCRFPNLLVNGSDGIAVGMATNIPPHNLREVINGVTALIDNPDITIEELMTYIPAPDFPTKAIIIGGSSIRHAYKTGRGGIILRARTEITEIRDKTCIVVTELPYQVNKSKLIMTMADLVKDKRIEGISNIKDESDRKGMRIVIEIKKDYNAQVILNYLFKHTQLQTSDGVIFLALVNNQPKICNLKEILYYYLEHQKEVVTRRTRYDLEKAEERAHILEGLAIALDNIDEVIATIKASKDKQVATTNLMQKFALTEIQANAILDMRLQRLTGLEIEKIREELEELHKAIIDFKDILAKPQRILDIIKAELIEIRDKYGVDRKSEISLDYSDIDVADLIEKEDVVISLTHNGYIKRIPVKEYRAQRRGGKGVVGAKTKEEDYVEKIKVTSTHDSLLFFTNFGRVYSLMGYEIPEASKQAQGRNMVNILQLMPQEKVVNFFKISDLNEGYLVIATKQGLIKKTELTEYLSIKKNGKIAIKLKEDDQLISVQYSTGNNEIIVATHEGKCARFSEEEVKVAGRDTQGVKSISLSKQDYLVDMIVIDPDKKLLTITENGFGKRSNLEDYMSHARGCKGIKAGLFSAKTGKMVCLKQVTEDDDILLITDNGTVIRISSNEISEVGRTTVGVRIMRTSNDSKVVAVAVTPKIEEEELEEAEEESEENFEAENLENTAKPANEDFEPEQELNFEGEMMNEDKDLL